VKIARILADCRERGATLSIIVGDARLQLAHAPDSIYDLLILDAFSSDSVPVHLLTRQALALYLQKLHAGGLLAFNISNRYLWLEPVLVGLARDAGLVGLVQHDRRDGPPGKVASSWVVLARQQADLGALATHANWQSIADRPATDPWTDDFSNLLSVLMWRQ
jgi:spermidine synthase